ncbi:tetratricopeptide repeat domain containing protein [Niveomyces insectorum RCEF 264]|uniref:ER membrane protein complex subunit 2 n=1 Tax=Niveomyces insectorum RCEF 264 TaxID=1081102 RepID=A0A167X4B9_9HYPO|nr:tetratricopeptide repeat domain containing protein [Niveomyces insectorum RCEF 264]
MTPSLLHPPSHLSPAEALWLSQRAPDVLSSLPSAGSSSILRSVVAPAETAETWLIYENLLMSCLRTGDIESARECIRRLVGRFGEDNDRVMALEGLVRETEAPDDKALLQVLKDYEEILKEGDTIVPIHKRRIALLRSLDKVPEAVAALIALLDFSPTDAEAWAELADLYLSQGLYAQAIYALEEVLVLAPNAWNMHARLGEVRYMAATTAAGGEAASTKHAAESLKRFCRSIELCDDYLRGYYGLKLSNNNNDGDDFALPDTATAQRLGQLATEKLSEIVRRSSAKEPHWRGYDEAEIVAARELLSDEAASIVR